MNLTRFLYREAPFKMLEKEELRRLESAFTAMIDAYPLAYYWTHRIDPERMLVLDFFHDSMRRYRGLEIVMIEGDTISYYRLPGALVGGTGAVPQGDYQVRIESPAGVVFLVDVRKNAVSRLDLRQCRRRGDGADETRYAPLPRNVLEPSKFADEMRSAIAGGIEWIYRNYRLAEPPGRAAIRQEMRDSRWPAAAAGVCDDADAYLWLLNNENEAMEMKK